MKHTIISGTNRPGMARQMALISGVSTRRAGDIRDGKTLAARDERVEQFMLL